LVHLFLWIKHARSSKVDNSNARVLALFVKEKILWLQITMDDVAGMAVVNCGQDLFDDVCGIFLAEELFLRDSLKKFSTIAQP
jgi:hypothetical protein